MNYRQDIRDGVAAAFRNHVGLLFLNLCAAGADDEAFTHFRAGLAIAEKARDLAETITEGQSDAST